jgi:rSAM/selenodomain-associated transferase 2
MSPFVSVIVPVLQDAAELTGLLETLPSHPDVEIVVANAAPSDSALIALRARYPHVRWVDAPVGRGVQMNHGAAAARGRWLFFLHADARPGPGWLDEIRAADRDGCVGGSFAFRLDSPRRAARVVEWGVARRVRWLGLAYGDQGLFVHHEVFDRLSGYRPLPLMEDVELIRRLGRVGRLRHSRVAVHSSPRRWERDGWVRRSATNTWLLGLYLVGVPPERLARIYYRRSPTE